MCTMTNLTLTERLLIAYYTNSQTSKTDFIQSIQFIKLRDVIENEFEFKGCRNVTIFPHPNPSSVQRQFSIKFELVLC